MYLLKTRKIQLGRMEDDDVEDIDWDFVEGCQQASQSFYHLEGIIASNLANANNITPNDNNNANVLRPNNNDDEKSSPSGGPSIVRSLENEVESLREQLAQSNLQKLTKEGEIKIIRENLVRLQGKNDELTRNLARQFEIFELERNKARNQRSEQIQKLSSELEFKQQELQRMQFISGGGGGGSKKRKTHQVIPPVESPVILPAASSAVVKSETPFVLSAIVKDYGAFQKDFSDLHWNRLLQLDTSDHEPLKDLAFMLNSSPAMRQSLMIQTDQDSSSKHYYLDKVVDLLIRSFRRISVESDSKESLELCIECSILLCQGHLHPPSFFSSFSSVLATTIPAFLQASTRKLPSASLLTLLEIWSLDSGLAVIIADKIIPLLLPVMARETLHLILIISENPQFDTLQLVSSPILFPWLISLLDNTRHPDPIIKLTLATLKAWFDVASNTLFEILLTRWKGETFVLLKNLWTLKWNLDSASTDCSDTKETQALIAYLLENLHYQ